MRLRDYIFGILSVPLSNPETTRLLLSKDIEVKIARFEEWLAKLNLLHPYLEYDLDKSDKKPNQAIIDIKSPYRCKLGITFVDQGELLTLREKLISSALTNIQRQNLDFMALALCADETKDNVKQAIEDLWQAARPNNSKLILMEPSWISAIVLEEVKPILIDQRNPELVGTASYFDEEKDTNPNVSIRRTTQQLRSLLGHVIDEKGTFDLKWRELRNDQIFEGPILLCTTFLPPVMHSVKFIERFYRMFGATNQDFQYIRDKDSWEKDFWKKHIIKHQRFDLIDRKMVEEYFAAPEYYQMILTPDELDEMVSNINQLLEFPNYNLSLTPEAVDICYEIRGNEVRIRSDRRNKGQPRQGRISQIILSDQNIADTFTKEFWSLYRMTEAKFKDKNYIKTWLQDLSKQYREKSKKTSQDESAHSPDFRSVKWQGKEFKFTAMQAACITILWKAWENGTPEVSQALILEEAESKAYRLIDLFKNNPAWNNMIVSGTTRGTYRLKS